MVTCSSSGQLLVPRLFPATTAMTVTLLVSQVSAEVIAV
jgi:hypothetical protein